MIQVARVVVQPQYTFIFCEWHTALTSPRQRTGSACTQTYWMGYFIAGQCCSFQWWAISVTDERKTCVQYNLFFKLAEARNWYAGHTRVVCTMALICRQARFEARGLRKCLLALICCQDRPFRIALFAIITGNHQRTLESIVFFHFFKKCHRFSDLIRSFAVLASTQIGNSSLQGDSAEATWIMAKLVPLVQMCFMHGDLIITMPLAVPATVGACLFLKSKIICTLRDTSCYCGKSYVGGLHHASNVSFEADVLQKRFIIDIILFASKLFSLCPHCFVLFEIKDTIFHSGKVHTPHVKQSYDVRKETMKLSICKSSRLPSSIPIWHSWLHQLSNQV